MSESNPCPVFFLAMPNSGANVVNRCCSKLPALELLSGLGEAASAYDQRLEKMTETCGQTSRALITETYAPVGTTLFHEEDCTFDIQNTTFTEWLASRQFSVVHFVRDNMLNYLAEQMVRRGVTTIAPDHAIACIEQLNAHQQQARTQLRAANCLEVKFEQLLRRYEEVSSFAVQQVCNFTGLEIPQSQTSPTMLAEFEQLRFEIDSIKRKLRPEMTRRGLENLFELPKAA